VFYRRRPGVLHSLISFGNPFAEDLFDLPDKVAGDALARQPPRQIGQAPRAPRSRALDDLAGASYVHLHCNRLLGGYAAIEQRVLQLLRRTREGLARAPVDREAPTA
jgi:hypothetical protein